MVEPDDVTRTKSETVLWMCLRNHTPSQMLLFLLLCPQSLLQPRLSSILLIPGMLLKGTCWAILLQKLQIQLLNICLLKQLKLIRNVLESQLKGSNLPGNFWTVIATETLFVVSFLYFGYVHSCFCFVRIHFLVMFHASALVFVFP